MTDAAHLGRTAGLALDPEVVATLGTHLPRVAERTVEAITAEVPGYDGTLTEEMRDNIELAVQMALGAFLRLAEQAQDADPSTPLQPAIEGAYALGRGEARSGRAMDALLGAYRVGARVSWRELSGAVVGMGLEAATVAQFAELVFAYIDQLSASSAAGHADELATSGRVRQRYLERLTQGLLHGASADVLGAAAKRADWKPPATLTAVVLPDDRTRRVLAHVDDGTLQPAEQVPGLEDRPDLTVLLVPVAGGPSRAGLLRRLHGSRAVVGPARPWHEGRSSYERALRVVRLELEPSSPAPVDTEAHLADLVLNADPQARTDLRLQVLAPLEELRPAAAAKLKETLRSWLLHQGRREEVAADLFVHPQTVRYRVQQLRELYGDRREDPEWVLRLTLALA